MKAGSFLSRHSGEAGRMSHKLLLARTNEINRDVRLVIAHLGEPGNRLRGGLVGEDHESATIANNLSLPARPFLREQIFCYDAQMQARGV